MDDLEGLNFNISLDSPQKSQKGAYIDKGSTQGLGVRSEEEQSSLFSSFASILTGNTTAETKEYQAPESHLYSLTN